MARVGPISLSDGSVRIPYHLSRPYLKVEKGEVRLTNEEIRALPARSLNSFGNSEYDEIYKFHVPEQYLRNESQNRIGLPILKTKEDQ